MAEKHRVPPKPERDDTQHEHEPDNRNVITKLNQEPDEPADEGADNDAGDADDRNIISKLNHEDDGGDRR